MKQRILFARLCALLLPAWLGVTLRPLPADPLSEAQPDNSGPLKLVTASLLGGGFDDAVAAAGFARDGSILLAGNAVDYRPRGIPENLWSPRGALSAAEQPAGTRRWKHPGSYGFLLRLTPDGRTPLSFSRFGFGDALLRGMRTDARGGIYLLGEAPADTRLGGVYGRGTFVAALSPDGKRLTRVLFQPDIVDFGIDGNGDWVLLSGPGLARYTPDGRTRRWMATWPFFGRNRPGALAIQPATGITTVVGYGMAHTGREPYKDPYAYGFDRDGREIWGLWNPDPHREITIRLGGNGLMADTAGHVAAAAPNGRFLLSLIADGANTVCARDPINPDQPLDPAVTEGVFQKTPGYGFRGASRTSVLFRVDPRTGRLEKGTWFCAWLNRGHANSLGIDEVAGAENGDCWAVGTSAARCPTAQPWFTAPEGSYPGGGYLAYFDAGFHLRQCGYFANTAMRCVAQRNGVVVIGGETVPSFAREGRAAPDRTPVFHPLQREPGGGRDGFFAVFRTAGSA